MNEFTDFTAILVRRNKTVRVLVSGVNESEARKAINQNWQNRNHPENAHVYLLVSEDGTVLDINPQYPKVVPQAASVKRPAIA